MTPVTSHATTSQNGEPRLRAILAEVMKIQEPIMEPATSIVASVSVNALTNSGLDCTGGVCVEPDFGAATLVIQLLEGRTRCRAHYRREGLPERSRKIVQLYPRRYWQASKKREEFMRTCE